jgi:DNA-3-methyladenine glycosylase
MLEPLPRDFYGRPTVRVARDLLGKVIVRQDDADRGRTRLARIVEVEAYLGERDLASHARRGPTPRAAIMFGPPGHLYTYLIYGMYVCANFVCHTEGVAGAVLIRAAAPLDEGDPAALRGPGKLCRELGIELRHKGLDLTLPTSPIYVADDGVRRVKVARSARIGIDYAGVWAPRLLRFYVPGNPSVSGPGRRLIAAGGGGRSPPSDGPAAGRPRARPGGRRRPRGRRRARAGR